MDDAIANIGRAFAKAADAAWLRTREWDFKALVDEYKQIEAEFAARTASSAVHVREIQRRIAEFILHAALDKEQPFAICQQWWNHLCLLGFSDVERRCKMVWFYASGCLFHEQIDAGLAVIEPLIAELEASLAEPTCTEQAQRFYHRELGLLRELWFDLMLVMKSLEAKSCNWEYAEVERQYREIETEFLAHFQPDDDSFMPKEKQRVQRTVTSALLLSAHELRPPFEVCRDLWNELVRWSFEDLEDRCEMTWFYADCCLRHGQRELGLAVVEPLRAELQRQVDTGTNEDMTPEQYRDEITRFEKLRDDLEALQSQNS